MGEKINLNKLRTKKEKIYFRISIALSIFIWVYFLSPYQIPYSPDTPPDFTATATTIGILILLQLLFTFISLLSMAYIRMNALKVSEKQFPELHKTNNELAKQLGLKKTPDIFIIQSGGLLNAFATKLVFRRLIILYSDLVDALTVEKDEKQVKAVLCHELGHHALGHTEFWINYLISPASLILPLGAALSRAREYSADRIMKAFLRDQEICSRSLVKLATGGKIGQKANIEAYLDQIKEEKGFLAWFAEIHSSHPFLPKRILALQKVNFHLKGDLA